MPAAEPEMWRTYVGSYSPVGYLPAALGVRLSSGTVQAIHRGRLVGAAVCLLLLALAVWCSWNPASVGSLTGLALAVTPMTVFLSATITQSGVEATAAIAAVAGMLRLRRSEPGGVPRLTWTAMAVGGFLLAATRPVGPGWLLQAAVLLVLLLPGVHLVEKAKAQ